MTLALALALAPEPTPTPTPTLKAPGVPVSNSFREIAWQRDLASDDRSGPND